MSADVGQYAIVNGERMHYLETGHGDPILFLHGVPASSYVWRKVLPHLAPLGRCIALDLIGFGKSAKPDIHYTIQDHIDYLDEFIKVMNLRSITLVMHGLGSILGFNYAMHHEQNCKGLVFYEPFLASGSSQDTSLVSEHLLQHFQGVEKNQLIDVLLQQSMLYRLSDVELQRYREPFLLEGSIKPILTYLNEISSQSNNRKMQQIITNYSAWLMKSDLPKLMLYSVPGFNTAISMLIWAKQHLPHLELVELGEELHFAQESSPDLMGESMSVWLQSVEQEER